MFGNRDWIEGFYIGLVWLSYEYSGDPYFKEQAQLQIGDFKRSLQQRICLEHDIGFLYGFVGSCRVDCGAGQGCLRFCPESH